MIIDGSKVVRNLREKYDVVVIGSGAGGAVVAKELAEGGMSVAILEEGPAYSTAEHTDLPFEAISRLYRDKGFTATLGKPAIAVPQGRVLGGTTVINSGTCFRTPTKILEQWQNELGLTELTESSFLPIFEKVESELNVTEGSFSVMSRANTIFHELLEKKGIQGKALYRNVKNCDGCGFCCYGCSSGAKQSMDISYLPKAFRAGAHAYTNCTFESVLSKSRRAQGVQASFHTINRKDTGYQITIEAPIIIFAAGTILTPQLLKKNRIASKNKNLGRNLTLHPATKVFARFDEEIRGWEGTPQAYYLDILKSEGITFEGIFVPPDIAAMTVPYVGKRLNEFMRDYAHMASFGFLINDASRGRIVNLPFLGTTAVYNMLQEDVEKFQHAIAYLSRIFLEGGANKVFTLLHGHTELTTLDDIEALENATLEPADIECMAFHPLGTCRMGTSRETGVVDTQNRVFDWEGIYVCDGSVVPTSLGVNPQVTIMSFATRLAMNLLKN